VGKKPKKAVSLAEPKKYRVEYTPAALAQLEKVPEQIRDQLATRIHKLEEDPRSQSDKLKGFDFYSLRQGDYRAIVSIQDDKVVVLVVRVGDRKHVYDRLQNIRT
jgi:mRNA interferase RelE/StbE